MKTVTISDELFEQLKSFVVDPFDDTPDSVVGRLVAIVNKAKSRWSPLDECEASSEPQAPAQPHTPTMEELPQEEEPIVML